MSKRKKGRGFSPFNPKKIYTWGSVGDEATITGARLNREIRSTLTMLREQKAYLLKTGFTIGQVRLQIKYGILATIRLDLASVEVDKQHPEMHVA